jgi:hypothetical protein
LTATLAAVADGMAGGCRDSVDELVLAVALGEE